MFFETWKPAADIFNCGKDWLVRVELAGVSPDEIELLVLRTRLTVRGRRRDVLVQQGFTCRALEINYTRFERHIELPEIIDPASLRYEYRDGILKIFLSTS